MGIAMGIVTLRMVKRVVDWSKKRGNWENVRWGRNKLRALRENVMGRSIRRSMVEKRRYPHQVAYSYRETQTNDVKDALKRRFRNSTSVQRNFFFGKYWYIFFFGNKDT
jgi:hypothetical protein